MSNPVYVGRLTDRNRVFISATARSPILVTPEGARAIARELEAQAAELERENSGITNVDAAAAALISDGWHWVQTDVTQRTGFWTPPSASLRTHPIFSGQFDEATLSAAHALEVTHEE